MVRFLPCAAPRRLCAIAPRMASAGAVRARPVAASAALAERAPGGAGSAPMGKPGMLTVHHLGKSQSERVVWLCEELGVPYELKRYERDPVTGLAPPECRALHPIGAAPVITDGGLVLAESGAVVEYVIAKHGGGRLAPSPDHPDFAAYLYWFHFSNGTLQPVMGRRSLLRRAGTPEDHPAALFVRERLGRALGSVEARLGEAEHFAGGDLTAADIMAVFSLTTMRHFAPLDLAPYPGILSYLRRIGARPAYRRAMEKGDPGMAPLLA